MVDVAELGFKVDTKQLKEGKKSLDEIKKSADVLKPALAGAKSAIIGLIAGFAGFATVSSTIRAFIRNTIEAEKVTAQLSAAVKSTGGAAGYSVKELQKQAAALQNITTFGDEAIQSMQSILLTFTQIRGAEFQAASMAILDLSTRTGKSLESAAQQIGKALNDPILGVSALNESGVQFTETQKKMIKGFVETNQIAKAQGVILAELDTQFGKSAVAARQTLGGSLDALKNAWGDLFEVGGEASEGIRVAIENLIDEINSPAFKAAVAAIGVSLVGALSKVASILPALANGFNELLARLNLLPTRIAQVAAQSAVLVDQIRAAGLAGEMPVTLQKYQNIAGPGLFQENGVGNTSNPLSAESTPILPSIFEKTPSGVPSLGKGGGGGGGGASRGIQDVIQELKDEAFALSLSENA